MFLIFVPKDTRGGIQKIPGEASMNNIFVGLIIAVIAGWFGYCLYRMWRGARGADCASCALGGDFDYGTYGREAVPEKPMEVVTSAGHHIIVDEEAARRRRERIRKMMEGK